MNWYKDAATWPHSQFSRFVLCKPHRWHVQQAGNGPTILLIHGAGGATQSWRHLFPLLTPQFTVVSVDLPGQGFTQLGAQQRCGLDAMVEDLMALCKAEGFDPMAIIGHSAGAAVALRMAERITPTPRVVGINAALDTFDGFAGVLFPLLAQGMAMMPLAANIFTVASSRPGAVERLIKGTGSTLTSEDMLFYRQLVASRSHVNATLQMMAQWKLEPLVERLAENPAQTLLIVGENDRAVPPAVSQRAAKKMPNARLESLPDLGHLAHEENAEAVAALMKEFLEEDA